MYIQLAKKNLLSQPARTILTVIGVAIGSASLLGILTFTAGIKSAVINTIAKSGPLTQITVEPPNREGNFLTSLSTIASQKDKITQANIGRLINIPHVKTVYPQINYDNISSLRVNIWDQSFQTDTMIFGVPFEFIEEDLTNPAEWQIENEPYPAIISRKIIDLYNLTVAPTNNLPAFSEEDIIGLEFAIMPGKSTFFPIINGTAPEIKAKIVGFSDKVDLLGVTIPIEVIRKFNLRQNPDYEETYLKVFLNVDDTANVEKVTAEIEKIGLKTRSTKLEIQVFEENFKIVTVGLSLISAIILLVAGLMIANTFLSSVNERKHEIGLLRALGATRRDIRIIFLVEASIIGLMGGLTGLLFCYLGGFIVDFIALSAFPDVTSKPDTLLNYDFLTIIYILFFTIILSVIFAFIPSAKAARLEPLKALSN